MSSNAVPVAVFLGSAVVLFCECLVETDPVGEAGFKDDLFTFEQLFDRSAEKIDVEGHGDVQFGACIEGCYLIFDLVFSGNHDQWDVRPIRIRLDAPSEIQCVEI